MSRVAHYSQRFTGTRIVVDRLVLAQEVNRSSAFAPTTSKILPFIGLRYILRFDCCGVLWTNVDQLRQIAGNLAGRFIFQRALTLEAILVDLDLLFKRRSWHAQHGRWDVQMS